MNDVDRPAVGRPARPGDLQRRPPDRPRRTIVRTHDVELRRPVVVRAGTFHRFGGERLSIRRPVIVVNVEIRWADFTHISRRWIDDSDSLLLNHVSHDAGVGFVSDQGAGLLRRAGDKQHGELPAVWRPQRMRELADHRGQSVRRPAAFAIEYPNLPVIGYRVS